MKSCPFHEGVNYATLYNGPMTFKGPVTQYWLCQYCGRTWEKEAKNDREELLNRSPITRRKNK